MTEFDHLLNLNNAHATETGPLTGEELAQMLATAFHSASVGAGKDGLLIAFDQDAAYQSPNFLWFKARTETFVYVDRIIVAAHARGRGLARTFYEDLFDRARKAGHERVVCEVNLDPPNPGSLSFHAALGFVGVGEAVLENGKTVRYMERALA
jgi:uncharacterized protein